METEIWKPIPKFEEHYEVSSFGRIRSIDRIAVNVKGITRSFKGRIKAHGKHSGGYHQAKLYKGRRICHYIYVHRIVAICFIGNPPEGKNDVNHKDGDKKNNHFSNLEWVSRSENILHSIYALDQPRNHAKLSPDQIKYAVNNYIPGTGGVHRGNSKEIGEMFGVKANIVVSLVRAYKNNSKKRMYYDKTYNSK